MIKYVQGDIFEGSEDIIAHGCNCAGGFGAGIAEQIAKKYPKASNHYRNRHDTIGWSLGDVQFVVISSGEVIIANCATQATFMPRNVCHADYPAIKQAMTTVRDWAQARGFTVAIPKIGAGLAGGDWNIIEKIIEEVFSDYDITVYYL